MCVFRPWVVTCQGERGKTINNIVFVRDKKQQTKQKNRPEAHADARDETREQTTVNARATHEQEARVHRRKDKSKEQQNRGVHQRRAAPRHALYSSKAYKSFEIGREIMSAHDKGVYVTFAHTEGRAALHYAPDGMYALPSLPHQLQTIIGSLVSQEHCDLWRRHFSEGI